VDVYTYLSSDETLTPPARCWKNASLRRSHAACRPDRAHGIVFILFECDTSCDRFIRHTSCDRYSI